MKNAMVRTALVSMMAIVPAMSFAQSTNNNGPLTRAQVRQEMVDLESVGYKPASADNVTYPEDVQAAMRRLAAKRANEARLAQQQVAQSGYGGVQVAPATESGAPASPRGVSSGEPSAYEHH